ncbi:MAG: hypothetical protein Q8P51_09240 [Ignavibacteria bacterium]|nr:hypothetical protein [Ignavibacteria bacterium]
MISLQQPVRLTLLATTPRVRILKSLSLCAVFCLAVTMELHGCKSNPVEAPPKNPREYTWTIDTIAYPGSYQTSMYDIWGSSPSDVYIVGYNSDGNANAYHYDGKSWSALNTGFNGTVLTAIHAFSSRDVWISGARYWARNDSSLIIHFDGSRWIESLVSGGRFLGAIWGSNPNDIWAAGWAGTAAHFDGSAWTKFPMDLRDRYYDIDGFTPKDVYLLGIRVNDLNNPSANYYLLQRYNGSAWSVMDSMSSASPVLRFGPYGLATYAGSLYSFGYGLHVLKGGQWHQEVIASAPIQGFCASSDRNIFIVGQQSLVYHFNGEDWKELKGIVDSGWWFHAVWCTETEAFIVGHDAAGRNSVVIHGQ